VTRVRDGAPEARCAVCFAPPVEQYPQGSGTRTVWVCVCPKAHEPETDACPTCLRPNPQAPTALVALPRTTGMRVTAEIGLSGRTREDVEADVTALIEAARGSATVLTRCADRQGARLHWYPRQPEADRALTQLIADLEPLPVQSSLVEAQAADDAVLATLPPGSNVEALPYYGMRQMYRHARGDHKLCVPANCNVRAREAAAPVPPAVGAGPALSGGSQGPYRTPTPVEIPLDAPSPLFERMMRYAGYLTVGLMAVLVVLGVLLVIRVALHHPVVTVHRVVCQDPTALLVEFEHHHQLRVYRPRTPGECVGFTEGSRWTVTWMEDDTVTPDYPE